MKNNIFFPNDYNLISDLHNTETSIVCGYDKESLLNEVAGKDYELIELTLNGEPYFIALKGFKIFSSPRTSRSGGSMAQYLASSINKEDGLLLQYLPKNSMTSQHYHEYTSEAFHSLAGNAVLYTLWDDRSELRDGNTVVHNTHNIHQVKTKDSDSLVLLQMISDLKDPGMKDHVYVNSESTIIDIHSKGIYPANALSNLHDNSFSIDGIECTSMEGFLQSLKERLQESQRAICALSGKEAKNVGERFNETRKTGDPVYWLGMEIDRFSDEYQNLLNRAYAEMSKNDNFKKALYATGDSVLIHSIGKSDKASTILTQSEFCSRLMRIRTYL